MEANTLNAPDPLESFKVGAIPTCYYVPDFITEAEENYLLKNIFESNKSKWKEVKGRRVQNWGGIPHPKGMVAVPLPDFLSSIGNKMAKHGIFEGVPPNHVLINEYHPGGGIMPHEDGPLYKPHFGILSLESTLIMDIFPHPTKSVDSKLPESDTDSMDSSISDTEYKQEPIFSIILQPRSLLVFKDELYTGYLHGIAFREKDVVESNAINLQAAKMSEGDVIERKRRVSFTIRLVNKVLKNTIKLH